MGAVQANAVSDKILDLRWEPITRRYVETSISQDLPEAVQECVISDPLSLSLEGD